MPIRRKAGESKEDFMGRCIPIEIASGKERDQAVAICYAYYDEKQLSAFKRVRRKNKNLEFKKTRAYVDSTNADRVMYNDETGEMVIKFLDGSIYTYTGVSQELFDKVLYGEARTKTAGPWGPIGKSPSVGAAIHKYLIEAGIDFSEGGNFR
jgi:hypothetical protein